MQREEEASGWFFRVDVVPNRFARHKETGHHTLQAAAPPIPSKGTVTNVFNWPATDAVYAAITCKVKNNP